MGSGAVWRSRDTRLDQGRAVILEVQKEASQTKRRQRSPTHSLFSFPRPLPGCAWVPRLQPAAPAGLSPSLHPVRRSSLRSWFIHTAWKGAGAGLHNTSPRICSAEERGHRLADNEWHWGLSVQMVGSEHVTSGRRKIIKTRAVVTQGPVMVPPAHPLISSQPNHIPRRQSREQVSGQFAQEETEAYGWGGLPQDPTGQGCGRTCMRRSTGAQEFGLDPFPWKSPEQTPSPPRDRPTLQVGSPFAVRRKTVLLLSESPHGGSLSSLGCQGGRPHLAQGLTVLTY